MSNKILKKDLKARDLHVKKEEYTSMKTFALCMICFWGGLVLGMVI
jgi:hypothetical protein